MQPAPVSGANLSYFEQGLLPPQPRPIFLQRVIVVLNSLVTFTANPMYPIANVLYKLAGLSNSDIKLQWQAPAKDNGSAVCTYIIEVCSTTGRGAPGPWQTCWSGPIEGCKVSLPL